jgi:hypothetical protein
MKAIRRVFLVILGLLMMGTGIFFLLATFLPLGGYGTGILDLYGQTVLLYAGGALAVAGLIPLLLGFSPPHQKRPEALLQTGEFGEVRITLNALENMVLRVVQQMRGIRDSSRRVVYTPHGLVVYLQVKVLPDQKLPDLTGELQSNVKNYLEEITGIIVSEVKVNVENIILDQVPVKVK